jgi:hypothetical protein
MIPLLVYGLATWRVASMFVSELGPGDLFLKLRAVSGITHDDSKRVAIIPDGFLPGVLSCVWCCSVWVGAFWMLFDLISPWLALRLATALSFSAVAILIQSFVENRR